MIIKEIWTWKIQIDISNTYQWSVLVRPWRERRTSPDLGRTRSPVPETFRCRITAPVSNIPENRLNSILLLICKMMLETKNKLILIKKNNALYLVLTAAAFFLTSEKLVVGAGEDGVVSEFSSEITPVRPFACWFLFGFKRFISTTFKRFRVLRLVSEKTMSIGVRVILISDISASIRTGDLLSNHFE